jgi:hypothetical protein
MNVFMARQPEKRANQKWQNDSKTLTICGVGQAL